jgi:hypothetical protein
VQELCGGDVVAVEVVGRREGFGGLGHPDSGSGAYVGDAGVFWEFCCDGGVDQVADASGSLVSIVGWNEICETRAWFTYFVQTKCCLMSLCCSSEARPSQ